MRTINWTLHPLQISVNPSCTTSTFPFHFLPPRPLLLTFLRRRNTTMLCVLSPTSFSPLTASVICFFTKRERYVYNRLQGVLVFFLAPSQTERKPSPHINSQLLAYIVCKSNKQRTPPRVVGIISADRRHAEEKVGSVALLDTFPESLNMTALYPDRLHTFFRGRHWRLRSSCPHFTSLRPAERNHSHKNGTSMLRPTN